MHTNIMYSSSITTFITAYNFILTKQKDKYYLSKAFVQGPWSTWTVLRPHNTIHTIKWQYTVSRLTFSVSLSNENSRITTHYENSDAFTVTLDINYLIDKLKIKVCLLFTLFYKLTTKHNHCKRKYSKYYGNN